MPSLTTTLSDSRSTCFLLLTSFFFFFFFNDTATTEIYTLSLHDALPIFRTAASTTAPTKECVIPRWKTRYSPPARGGQDRKSTRLNSSHEWISYAVFCLKKKKKKNKNKYVIA